MTSRERVLLALEHREADRVAITDGPWHTTVARWHREGLPEGVTPADYFGYEFSELSFDATLQFPEETIEETDEYWLRRNSWGAVIKDWKHTMSVPEWTEFSVNNRADWEEVKPRLLDWNDDRVDWETLRESYDRARREGKFVFCWGVIGHDQAQLMVGTERMFLAMAEEPDWVKDMFDSIAEITIRGFEEILGAGLDFDAGFLGDDLGYRNGLLYSPRTFRELSKPAHKLVCDFLKARGKKTVLHSCGCVKDLIPDLIECGYDCLQPLEVKAGMDLVELKKRYGDVLALMGGIDVRAMAHPDPTVIEEEIRTKIRFAKRGGGYIYHSDHSVPDNVSFRQYCRVIDLVRDCGSYTRPREVGDGPEG